MKNKQLTFLTLIILVVILALVLDKFNIFHRSAEPYFGRNIDQFCLNDRCYQVNDPNLNQEIISPTIEKWKTIKLIDIISENKDKFKDLGFDPQKKVVLKINNQSLEIGQITSDYTGTLVKKENEDKIYKINVVINKDNINDPNYWANTTK